MKIAISLFLFFFNTMASDIQVLNNRHGGIMNKTEHSIIEFVPTEDNARIYIQDAYKKNLASDKLLIQAVAKIDGRELPMKLSFENDYYALSPYELLKKEKKYVVSFLITFPFPGSTEKASFNVDKTN